MAEIKKIEEKKKLLKQKCCVDIKDKAQNKYNLNPSKLYEIIPRINMELYEIVTNFKWRTFLESMNCDSIIKFRNNIYDPLFIIIVNGSSEFFEFNQGKTNIGGITTKMPSLIISFEASAVIAVGKEPGFQKKTISGQIDYKSKTKDINIAF